MIINITKSQFDILISIGSLTLKRKDNKNIYINANSIAKYTGLTWKTVNKNLQKLKNIEGV